MDAMIISKRPTASLVGKLEDVDRFSKVLVLVSECLNKFRRGGVEVRGGVMAGGVCFSDWLFSGLLCL